MCSETFLRLPEEKRKRIIDAAWEEFTRVSFADASINKIVHRAGIARGSFYQYFKDKEALVAYLLRDAWNYLAQTYRQVLQQCRGDIFVLQLACYDRFQDRIGADADPVLRNFLHFLRINPGMDMQKLATGYPADVFFEEAWPDIDTARLKDQEKGFVRQVMVLCLMCLATVAVDSVLNPEKSEVCRSELAQRLEIIRCGSVKQ